MASSTFARAAIPFVAKHTGYLDDLLAAAKGLEGDIPPERSSFYQTHLLTQILIHKHSLAILGNYAEVMARRSVEKAERALDQVKSPVKFRVLGPG